MKFVKNILVATSALACVSADSDYKTNYEVSRAGKDVKYVYQISAQGSSTPKKALNLTKSASDEPTTLDYVTALGIR